MAAPKGNQYAKGCKTNGVPKIYDDDFIENEAIELRKWIAKGEGLYIDSFARARGYPRGRMWEWTKTNQDFKDAMEEAKLWQEEKFLMKGLTKEWDSAQVRYTMARICGDKWKASYDATTETTLKELATAVMNYATAQPQDKGWQKPEEKPKKK